MGDKFCFTNLELQFQGTILYRDCVFALIERINKFDALRSGLGSESLGSEYGFKYLIDAIDSCKEIGISLSKYLKLYNKKSLMKKRQFTKLYKTSDTNYHFNFSIC